MSLRFYLLSFLSVLLLGCSTFLRKLAVDRIHPYQLQIVAGFIYAIEVSIWVWLLRRQGISGYDPMGVMWAVLCILFSVLSAVLFSHLLRTNGSPSIVAMMIASNPLVVLFLSWLFLDENITVRKILGCIVTIAGLFLLT